MIGIVITIIALAILTAI